MFRTVFFLALLGTLATSLVQCADADKTRSCCACGPDEQYEANSYTRQLSCDNMELGPIIGPDEPTTNACFCNDGYVRNSQGICIKRENCPIKTCPLNEHYEKNSNRCQITCANMHLEPIMGPCGSSSACFCNNGFVRNEKGICIKREKCPPRCPPFERYLNQTVQCQITCRTMPLEPYMGPCWPASGCFCLPGYVRNDAGICIRRVDCPSTCKKGEKYTDCGSSCPETCESRGDTCKFCTQQCVPGCFCAGNTIRAPNGTCVEPKKCPPRTCSGQNEEFVNCPPTCPPTEKCSNIWSRFDCSNPIDCCKPSCRCKSGFYRNDQNVCISTQQCTSTCKKGEKYTDCGSSCPETCETRGDTCKVCTQQCVPGCFCAGNTIRAPDGTCVEPKKCPPRTCSGQNEQFVNCPPTCPPTEKCSNIWSKFDCSNPIDCCKPSCRCKSGFYRNDQNVCISTQQCICNSSGNAQTEAEAEATAGAEATAQAKATAGAEATAEAKATAGAEATAEARVYYRRQISCDNLQLSFYIKPGESTTSACFCDEGYVRNSQGICINIENCPRTCSINEHFEKRTNRCDVDCAELPLEPRYCSNTNKCVCNKGYVRNKGICIKRENCPPSCPRNEEYLNQTTRCDITCRTPLDTDMEHCRRTSGCFCRLGYARNYAGICILRPVCPGCKKNERYTDCGTMCPETCESRGETCKACPQPCVIGCECDENTIRAPDGTCVEPEKCPPRTCSGQNEEFVVCPPNCPPTEKCSNIWSELNCTNRDDCCTPSCRCKPGFYRNDQNVCISTQQCIYSFTPIRKLLN